MQAFYSPTPIANSLLTTTVIICYFMMLFYPVILFYLQRKGNCYATIDNQDTDRSSSGHHSFCLYFSKIFLTTLPALCPCRFPHYSLHNRGISPKITLITKLSWLTASRSPHCFQNEL